MSVLDQAFSEVAHAELGAPGRVLEQYAYCGTPTGWVIYERGVPVDAGPGVWKYRWYGNDADTPRRLHSVRELVRRLDMLGANK